MKYILTSFIVFSLAQVKVSVALGIDIPFILPVGMLFVDSFGVLIGIAIVKHQLFDITSILKKGTVYSILAVIIIFLFSLSENLIATYFSEIAGEFSEYLYFISIAIVIGTFIPLKKRLDRIINNYFAKKKVSIEF
jgi:hypothetical protein